MGRKNQYFGIQNIVSTLTVLESVVVTAFERSSLRGNEASCESRLRTRAVGRWLGSWKINSTVCETRVVSKIDSPGMLAPAIYYFCWLEKGGEQVELKSILLWKAEEVKMSTSV